MTRKLIALSEDTDAVKAIETLLDNRISGAPVVARRRLLGVFFRALRHERADGLRLRPDPLCVGTTLANRDMERVVPPEMPILERSTRGLFVVRNCPIVVLQRDERGRLML